MTTPGFKGANVDSLSALATSLDTGGQTLTTIRLTTGRLLDTTFWQGNDAIRFRVEWDMTWAPSLASVSQALQSAAASVQRQRERQDAASDNGTNPGPGTGAGTGTGTAPSTTPVQPPAHQPPPADDDSLTPAAPAGAAPGPQPTAARPAGEGSAAVTVPFYSQFIGGHGFQPGSDACFRAATAMARDAGVTVLGPGERIQVATSENSLGGVTINPTAAAEGRSYIDAQLDADRPVVVGVSHKNANYNVDGITDHFVIITGRGVDTDGHTYYTFHDPATRHASVGADTNPANRILVDDSGRMYSPGTKATGYVTDRYFDVSMVRRNGK